jgi:hypothetical protein
MDSSANPGAQNSTGAQMLIETGHGLHLNRRMLCNGLIHKEKLVLKNEAACSPQRLKAPQRPSVVASPQSYPQLWACLTGVAKTPQTRQGSASLRT